MDVGRGLDGAPLCGEVVVVVVPVYGEVLCQNVQQVFRQLVDARVDLTEVDFIQPLLQHVGDRVRQSNHFRVFLERKRERIHHPLGGQAVIHPRTLRSSQ